MVLSMGGLLPATFALVGFLAVHTTLPHRVVDGAMIPPSELAVGAQFPLFKRTESTPQPDGGGRRRLAAFLLAIDHVNNKTDGFWDELLPAGPHLNVSVYDSRRSEGTSVINAFMMWEKSRAVACAGPASSGPTARAQTVLSVQEINMPQISYSATAPGLSDVGAFPKLLRTVPSDNVQAKIIADVIHFYGWRRVCTLSGSDEYSAGGFKEFRRRSRELNITLGYEAAFSTGTNDLSSEISALDRARCSIVVLWAQADDIRRIGNECFRQKVLTASDSGTLWFSSELFAGSFVEVCRENLKMCSSVFRGALLVTPNFGPGLTSYPRFKNAWHSQKSFGTGNGGQCDMRRDALGKHIWMRDHDGEANTASLCASVNFQDYDRDQAAANAVETTGDGRVSPYVPWAYDAAITIAQGIDRIYNPSSYSDEPTRDSSQPYPNPYVQPAFGDLLYDTMKRTKFSGFSGEVSFNQETGDRDTDSTPYFFWNFADGSNDDASQVEGFTKVGTFTERPAGASLDVKGKLTLTTPVVWPRADMMPDDRLDCDPLVDFITSMGECDVHTGTRTYTLELKPNSYCRIAALASVEGSSDLSSNRTSYMSTYKETYVSRRCSWIPFESPAGITIVATCSIVFLLQVFWLFFVLWYRKTNTLKYSQVEFIAIIIIGLLSGSVTQLTFLGLPNDVVCNVRTWMWNLPLALVTTPLLVKIRRVYLIFENKTLKRRKDLGLHSMMILLLKIVSITLLILIIGTAVPQLRAVAKLTNTTRNFVRTSGSLEVSNDDASQTHQVDVEEIYCTEQGSAGLFFSAFRACIHAFTIIAVAFLGYKARNVPSSFNESSSLNLVAMCLLGIGGITGVVSVASADLDLPPVFRIGITTAGVLISITVSSFFLLFPKWLYIRAGDHRWNESTASTSAKNVLHGGKSNKPFRTDSSNKSVESSSTSQKQVELNIVQESTAPQSDQSLRKRLKEQDSEILRLKAEVKALTNREN